MDLEELLMKYRMLPIKKRVIFWAVATLVGVPMYYWSDYDRLVTDLKTQQNVLISTSSTLDANKKKRERLPDLEQKFELVNKQLRAAKEALPDTIILEEVLEKVASLAQESGVTLHSFVPNENMIVPKLNADQSRTQVRYAQKNIRIVLQGSFDRIARFLDRIARVRTSIFVTGLDLNYLATNVARGGRGRGAGNGTPTIADARKLRDDLQLECGLNLAVYKSAG